MDKKKIVINDEIDVGNLLHTVWRHRLMILLITTLSTVVFATYAKVYATNVTVSVKYYPQSDYDLSSIKDIELSLAVEFYKLGIRQLDPTDFPTSGQQTRPPLYLNAYGRTYSEPSNLSQLFFQELRSKSLLETAAIEHQLAKGGSRSESAITQAVDSIVRNITVSPGNNTNGQGSIEIITPRAEEGLHVIKTAIKLAKGQVALKVKNHLKNQLTIIKQLQHGELESIRADIEKQRLLEQRMINQQLVCLAQERKRANNQTKEKLSATDLRTTVFCNEILGLKKLNAMDIGQWPEDQQIDITSSVPHLLKSKATLDLELQAQYAKRETAYNRIEKMIGVSTLTSGNFQPVSTDIEYFDTEKGIKATMLIAFGVIVGFMLSAVAVTFRHLNEA